MPTNLGSESALIQNVLKTRQSCLLTMDHAKFVCYKCPIFLHTIQILG